MGIGEGGRGKGERGKGKGEGGYFCFEPLISER